MSQTVWTPTLGWHDGPECAVLSVVALNSRADLQFISDSQDTAAIRFDFGPAWLGFDYDSYFVRIEDGEYKEVWGMAGIVPYLSKIVTRVL
jgi:hypothetical protein